MGFTAQAYTGATFLREADGEEEYGYDSPFVIATYIPEFSHAALGLDFFRDIETDLVFSVENVSLNASISYGGYSKFREQLTRMIKGDYDVLEKGDPFWSLVWMSDVHGFFSTETCYDIAQDFLYWQEDFQSIYSSTDFNIYLAWTDVFCAASGDGIVVYG